MEYSQLIKERYSIRKFSDKIVENEKLTAILEAARVAPTAVNKQPYRVLVLQGAEQIEELKKSTPYTFGVTTALVVCSCADEAWVRSYDSYNSGTIDASIIGTHIMLAVYNMGLGTTWVGHFDPYVLRESFGIPDNMEAVAVFPVGYPAEDAKPAGNHEKRRPLSELVVYGKF